MWNASVKVCECMLSVHVHKLIVGHVNCDYSLHPDFQTNWLVEIIKLIFKGMYILRNRFEGCQISQEWKSWRKCYNTLTQLIIILCVFLNTYLVFFSLDFEHLNMERITNECYTWVVLNASVVHQAAHYVCAIIILFMMKLKCRTQDN